MSKNSEEQPESDQSSADNRLQLDNPHWAIVLVVTLLFVFLVPRIWTRIEEREARTDYRVPYSLSKDYWLYSQHLSSTGDGKPIFVLGDSVIWGEFVAEEGTLSASLNQLIGTETEFKNAGVNGLFPLALEGLVRNYGTAMNGHRVLLHCNLLWMSNPEADLSTKKTRVFNHQGLVPQFTPWLPCYAATLDERVDRVVHRRSSYFAWANHIQQCYFDGHSIPDWTLADQGDRGSNAYRNPLTQITYKVPEAPSPDPDRGRLSERHRSWNERGLRVQSLEWVDPDTSQQWPAFCRLVDILRKRNCRVLIVVGPLNRHMMVESSQHMLDQWQARVADYSADIGLPCVVLTALDSAHYADASHPLTDGYRKMAEALRASETFQEWKQR